MVLKPTASVPSTVQLDKVPLDGVPSTGVVNVGLVPKTTAPDPVEVVTPVPPLATGSVPVTSVVKLTFVTVLFAALIVLLVSVSELDAVMMFVGVMIFDRFAIIVP